MTFLPEVLTFVDETIGDGVFFRAMLSSENNVGPHVPTVGFSRCKDCPEWPTIPLAHSYHVYPNSDQ